MEKPVKIIQIDSMDGMVSMMKYAVAASMTDWEKSILELEIPKREDFTTEEEYQVEIRQYMVDLVDEVKEIKGEVFKSVLDSYNNYLSSKYEIESTIKKQNEQCVNMYINATADMKRAGILTVVLTLFVPQALPILLVLDIPRVGIDLLARGVSKKKMKMNEIQKELFSQIQIPFFDFTCDLRSDYHKSNKELDELRKKALNGENVIGNLLEIVNPERVNLKRVESSELLPFVEVVEEEQQKQLTKKDNH